MKTIGIIPARYASTRFPGKPLIDLGGKSMIQRVYEQCNKAGLLDKVVVATDDDRIFDHVQSWHGQVVMTGQHHQSGTDRIAEVARSEPGYDVVVNIQGDEPLIPPLLIDTVIQPLLDGKAEIATAARLLTNTGRILNPNIVKVVFDNFGKALYFSRSPIPYIRQLPRDEWATQSCFYQHIGIYGFQREVLLEITKAPMGQLEQLECLEQLRWLQMGKSIIVQQTEMESIGIDTPLDLKQVLHRFL